MSASINPLIPKIGWSNFAWKLPCDKSFVSHGILHICSASQCVAVRCSVLQCVAVCCSVLQCVAACCSVLQCLHTESSIYNSFHHNCYTPEIHQIQRLRFLGISRYKVKLRFWLNLNWYQKIRNHVKPKTCVLIVGRFWRQHVLSECTRRVHMIIYRSHVELKTEIDHTHVEVCVSCHR